jgi:iron uptake system component EfeO
VKEHEMPHRQPRPALRAAAAGITGIALVAGLAACGSGGPSGGDGGSGAREVDMSLTDAGCSPARISIPAGATTFRVANSGAAAVTELEVKARDGIILGERENVVPGISGSFTLTMTPGRYVLSCPIGEGRSEGVLTVTGTPRAAPPAGGDPAAG